MIYSNTINILLFEYNTHSIDRDEIYIGNETKYLNINDHAWVKITEL